MAVKHKVVDYEDQQNNINNPNYISIILRVLEKYRNEPHSLPQGSDLIKFCSVLVNGLGMLQVPHDAASIASFSKDVRNVQEFLSNVCVTGQLRETLILVMLKQLYNQISTPPKSKLPGAAMSVVLQLVDTNQLPVAINMILEGNNSDTNLEQALMTLCYWLTYWTKTPKLTECVLLFMQGLESQKRFEILINVTLKYILNFFILLNLPSYRPTVGPIVLCMLTRMRATPEAFHKIIPEVSVVANNLSQDITDTGTTYLQNIVNICKALSEHFPGYDQLYKILEPVYKLYPPSPNYRTYLNCTSWSDDESTFIVPRSDTDKVGLNNLGNTCYMNSVLQALFMTKLFTNNVLINEHRWPLISKLQSLFALLQYSQCSSLSPSDILQLARPPGFHPGHQHDSSEFLGYLLDILHEQEKSVLPTFVRDEPMIVSTNLGKFIFVL